MPAAAARKPVEPPLLSSAFSDAIESGVANGAYASVAVGVIDGKRSGTFYFGHRDGAQSKPADDDSLFELGAVSEVFTGILLAQAAVEGKLRFSDPVEKFLPPSFPFADARLGKITLAQLATQHSVLPAQPANLFPDDLDDPYAVYAAEDLLALLAFQHGSGETGETTDSYSVLNAGLLGHLLGRVYQTAYTEALASKVLAPLGLQHVSFTDGGNLLPGHAHGAIVPHWHYGVLAGAAGLRASLPDMLAFLQRNLTPEDSTLRPALLLARQPQAMGPVDQIGFGWNVREKSNGAATWPLVWRASRTAGFASFVGFRTDRQRAIVLLGNASEDVAALGMAWLADSAPPPAPRASDVIATNRLDDYPGLYQITTGNEAVVRVTANRLSLQLPGEFPRRLRAADKDVFVADSGTLGVTFMRGIDDVNGLVLHAGNSNVSAARLSMRAPRLTRTPIATTAAARDTVAGDYRLDDANWLRIASSEHGLTLQWTLGERRSIFAYAPDRYTDAEGVLDLRLLRDTQGRVAKLHLELAGASREAVPVRRPVP
ncbi:serine hydrolase domain-containing protein [Rudaea sp.]|uniref:serine hydrolase domain-containing protein n=1 Tax=Rudaea sp. TaxID=2136325 RepID=UPI002ED4447C